MKVIRNLLVFLFLTAAVYPQQLGVWKNYASLQKIRDAYVTDRGIWAVSQGGAFYFNFEDSSYSILNKAEGLSNNSLSAVTLDSRGKVWFGSENGSIDVYDPAAKSFKRILEIANTNRISKKINELYARGDTIFVSTDFGVSLVNSNTLSFYESCAKFGDFFSDAKVLSTYKDNVTYVCTQYGIAVQKSSFANFSAPESWNTYPNSAFQLAGTTNQIIEYRDTILAATDKGLFYFNGNSWAPKVPIFPYSLNGMMVKRDSLFLLTFDKKIISYANGSYSLADSNSIYKKLIPSSVKDKFYVITDAGVVNFDPGKYRGYIFPNGPRVNTFADMSIDKNGILYVASGRDAVNLGYYKFDGNSWFNYNVDQLPGFINNSIFDIYISPDNARFLGGWGSGFARITDKDTITYTPKNTGISGIPGNPNYLVITGINNDSKGNLWVTIDQSATKKPLSKLSTDNTWTQFSNPLDASVIRAWGPLVIDNNDTKWFLISSTEAQNGQYLYYFNEKPLYPNSDINGWGKITTDDGLTTGAVKALALGRRGELWVGTSEGISIIDDPSQPKKGGNNISTVYLMRSQNVNCIAVDALNQKWVGTDKGVFLLSSDGTKLIENYTIDNSPLPSNSITSIAIDNNSGTVYIGTDYGLASVTTNSVNPQENLNGMYAYPNPVVVDKNSSVIINISGLVRDSEIKIFTISGKMVVNFLSPGAGIATWDGRDSQGNIVPTGIYLIVAFDKEGNNVGTTKVALVKK